jgi:Arc/MetJ-type ribon-helix-helix transcriptional regulator
VELRWASLSFDPPYIEFGDYRVQIDLPPEVEKFVAQELRAGHFATLEEMIVAGLWALLDERASTIADIRLGWESARRGEGIELAEMDRLFREEHGLPPRD